MPSGNAPTVRQRRIGSALRKARDHHNLTVATVARRFGRSQGWMSMVENGLQAIAPEELSDLLDLYEIEDGPLRESLLHLATHKPGSWERTYEDRISAAALDLASLEEDSAEIRTFQSNIVPGLLQIPDYARKIIALGNAKHPHRIKTLVDFRISRQRVLSRPDPPRYVPIIAEAVLHNQVGGDAAIMHAQVQSLAGAARLDHVELRVLPSRASEYLGLSTPFHLLSLRPPGRLTVCVGDQLTKSVFVEDENEVAAHEEIFERLLSVALSRTASLRLIHEIASRP
ncbi:transcriptional regulator with XRE-family HTH domain [Actinomadura coerulea]|uniref:Transcriptional regulator with XRE-family HTH domain n=1 Tax=Actinomadura coerulea TaxID=46159 RepID=A0A7X0FZA4_9ACTN|nr:helix-turn-helix transcriptional regulator [Actinomadura coerulea]MBB6396507.1 transcriptional regulator with XRE-family HTH domain [Actinomadura coerulea]GGQ05691.1 transcriptional regulator [Actinomadura coerulea]